MSHILYSGDKELLELEIEDRVRIPVPAYNVCALGTHLTSLNLSSLGYEINAIMLVLQVCCEDENKMM